MPLYSYVDMVKLRLKSKDFQASEKWPLLYVLSEIYLEEASAKRPLLDSDAVRIAKEEYGLEIERRTVVKYRDYLSSHFGFRFGSAKKGHYIIKNGIGSASNVQAAAFGDNIEVYNSPFEPGKLEDSISIIEQALQRKKELSLTIGKYLRGKCPLVVKDTKEDKKYEEKSPITIGPKEYIVTPLRLFRFGYPLYLFAYCSEEKRHYIFLVASLDKVRISKKIPLCPPSSFDFENFIQKQRYIITGPVNEDDRFVYGSYDGYPDEEGDFVVLYSWGGNRPAYGFLPQTLSDLYSKEVSRYAYDLDDERDQWNSRSKKYVTKTTCEHFVFCDLPYDKRLASVLGKIEREIGDDFLDYDNGG